eukprot:scaffold207302_cov39-Tisochrysis_lutea.AAC.2
MCHLRLGNIEKARIWCTKALNMDPENVKVRAFCHSNTAKLRRMGDVRNAVDWRRPYGKVSGKHSSCKRCE